MNLMETAANLLSEKLGVDVGAAIAGLQRLLGDGDGNLDIGALVSTLQQAGLADAVSSWLGDGANQGVDPDALTASLGGADMASAADTMGVSTDTLANGLSDVIPQLIDRASSGGSLLDSLGGIGGLAGMAKKFF
jgi:uncharacterized protein YidB (DUF937 family)